MPGSPVAPPAAALSPATQRFTWAALATPLLCCGCWPISGTVAIIAFVLYMKSGGEAWPIPPLNGQEFWTWVRTTASNSYFWPWARTAIGAILSAGLAFISVLGLVGNWISS